MKKLYRMFRGYLNDFILALPPNRKLVYTYLPGVVLTAVYLGMLCFIGKKTPADFFMKTFQVLAFIGAGVLHLYLLNKTITFQRLRFSGEGIVTTLFLSIIICFTLLFFYLFTDNSMAIMAFTCSLAFAVPHICMQAWFLYKNIHPKEYPLWISPLNIRDENEVLKPEMITFCFSIPDTFSDVNAKTHYKTVPAEWKLGKAFYTILNSDDSPIEDHDKWGNPYGWEFHSFLFRGLLKYRLEPEETISDNMIGKKTIVFVTRIIVKNAEQPVIHKLQYKTIVPVKNLTRISTDQKMELVENNPESNL